MDQITASGGFQAWVAKILATLTAAAVAQYNHDMGTASTSQPNTQPPTDVAGVVEWLIQHVKITNAGVITDVPAP